MLGVPAAAGWRRAIRASRSISNARCSASMPSRAWDSAASRAAANLE
jgi:hypothetical protein